MLTKQNYMTIAEILQEHKSKSREIVSDLVNYFEKDNPNFNRETFFKACDL